ncbi:MAG: alpha/beta hydrolase [Paracoccaceae bacterium]
MKRLYKLLVAVIMLVAIVLGLRATDVRPGWPPAAMLVAPGLAPDLDTWLAEREALYPDITEGAEKHIFWAREPGERTPLVILYFHGFSATRREISPVPERVAQELGANLFATRFTGHGLPGEALGQATPIDWALDVAEAMAVAQRLGDRVVIISTSTGGSIATLTAADPTYADRIAGLVSVSPNYEINDPLVFLLDWPHARSWVPLAVGETRSWQPESEDHARFWTTSYPTRAVFPLRTVQRTAAEVDHTAIQTPLLVYYSLQDQVVSPAATEAVIARWGGPVTAHVVTDADDSGQHVITGDIRSPTTTNRFVAEITEWIRAL